MEAIENYPMQYPVFEADQVLTNDDLNDMFTYLDEQERLTRIKLIGMGIVCGLELQYNDTNSAISISKGCGVTSWGYLITQDAVTLTYYQDYFVPSMLSSDDQYAPFTNGAGGAALYELLSDDDYGQLADPSKATALNAAGSSFLQDMIVVLYLELNPDDLKNCLSGDCDNKGIIMGVTVKRLLIRKEDLQSAPGTSSPKNIPVADALPDLFLQRMNVPAIPMTMFEDIYRSYATIFDVSVAGNIIDRLSQALALQYQLFQPLLSEFTASPFTQVKDTLVNYLDDIAQSAPYNIQYYYDFIDDLVKAYNELKNRGHQLISTCYADPSLFPLHLLIGPATVPTAGQVADFRTYFMYSPLFAQQQSLVEELRLLFRRIVLMIDSFSVPAPTGNVLALRGLIDIIRRPENTPIRITPSDFGRVALSGRAIPYYYEVNGIDPIQNSWNYRRTNAGKANENLSYHANLYNTLPQGDPFVSPLKYDIESYHFFRIEGHIGQRYTSVLQHITDMKNAWRLPFDIVTLKLGSDSADLQPGVDCRFSDLESEYALLKSELYCQLGNQMCYYANLTYSSRLIPVNLGGIFKDIQLQKDLNIDKTKKTQFKKIGTVATQSATDALTDVNETSTVNLAVIGLQPSDVIKYTSALDIADRALFQLNIYQKGQFLSNLPCFKQSLTASILATSVSIGQAYLSKIKSGGVAGYQPTDFDLLGDYLLKVVDNIEDVISSIYYVSLGNLDIDMFITKMNALIDYANILKTFISNPGKAVIPAGLSDYLSKLPACFNDKLKALISQYQVRFKQLQQDLLFSNFIARHPGIEHKAGVPKGGTFILVYYEAPATTPTATDVNVANVSVAANPDNASLKKTVQDKNASAETMTTPVSQSDSIYNDLLNVVQDKKYSFTVDQRNAILGQLKQIAPAASNSVFQLTDQSVVADFYLPYLCCSGCGSITYVFRPETTANPTHPPAFSIQPDIFLYNDQNSYPFNIYPPVTQQNIVLQAPSSGQLANPDGLPLTVNGDSLTLIPSAANVMKSLASTLQYEGISLTVTIIKPSAAFTIEITRPAATADVPPYSIKLSAVDKNADRYTWTLNGSTDVLKAAADPDALSQDQVKTLMADSKTLDISLIANYVVNGVTGSDTKKVQLTARQITALINKGAQELKYV